jgi:16S rRNA processing protein RimM
VADNRSELVAVGEILRPYGVRGAVKVRPLTDRPDERFPGLDECFLLDRGTGHRERCRIVAHRIERDDIVLQVEGVTSPEAARALQGRLLAVERADVLPAAEGHFYPWQLEGAQVQTVDGRPVGRFVGVEGSPAQPLWIVAGVERQHLIPAVPEIVVEVSLAEQRIVIDPPAGLLDL